MGYAGWKGNYTGCDRDGRDHGDLVQEKLTELNLNKYQKNNKI